MLLDRGLTFGGFGEVFEEKPASTAINLWRLVSFSAFGTEHNAIDNDSRRAVVHFNFRRRSSFAIRSSSLLICPVTEEFSSARRIRYGIESRTGPYGTYFVTL